MASNHTRFSESIRRRYPVHPHTAQKRRLCSSYHLGMRACSSLRLPCTRRSRRKAPRVSELLAGLTVCSCGEFHASHRSEPVMTALRFAADLDQGRTWPPLFAAGALASRSCAAALVCVRGPWPAHAPTPAAETRPPHATMVSSYRGPARRLQVAGTRWQRQH